MPLEVKITKFLVDTGKTGAEYSLHPMQISMLLRLLIQLYRIRTNIRQKPWGESEQIKDTRNRDENSYFAQLEHSETFISGFQYHAMHHQIGWCAY